MEVSSTSRHDFSGTSDQLLCPTMDPEKLQFLQILARDYESLFNSTLFSDVKIYIKNTVINAHQLILSTRNAVFASQVGREVSAEEALIFKPKDLVISDHDLEPFKVFLRYLYFCEIKDEEYTKELLKIAVDYKDLILKDTCASHLIKNVQFDNAIELLLSALDCKCEELKVTASDFIADNYDFMRRTDEFASVLKHNVALQCILDSFSNIVKKNENLTGNLTRRFRIKLPSTKSEFSDTFHIFNMPWKLRVSRIDVDGVGWASMCLICDCTDTLYSCSVVYTLKLVSYVDEFDNVQKENLSHTFSNTSSKMGCKQLIRWADLTEQEGKYVRNDLMLVEVSISAQKVRVPEKGEQEIQTTST